MHWFFDAEFDEQSSVIAASELVHFKSLRIVSGEEIVITTGKGHGFLAKVIEPTTGLVKINERVVAPEAASFHLIQAIAKGGRDESALQSCVELGIHSATALQAQRSIARWDEKVPKNLDRWEQIAISAIKQSQQLSLPVIEFAGSVADVKARGISLVLDPRANSGIAGVELGSEYSIAVGPEGGFSEDEVASLIGKGFRAVRLGDSMLRTSNAGVVALACLQLSAGQLGKDLV